MGTPRLAGTLRTRELQQGCRAARSPPACTTSGRLCLLHSVPRSPGLGRVGPPQPLSAAGDGLGVPPAAFRGARRAELGPAEGDEEAPRGDLQREHAGTAAPGLLHMVAPQCASLPENVRAAGEPAQQPQVCLWMLPMPWGDVLRASSTHLQGLLPPSCLHFYGEVSSRRLSPDRDTEPVCCDSSTPGSEFYMKK